MEVPPDIDLNSPINTSSSLPSQIYSSSDQIRQLEPRPSPRATHSAYPSRSSEKHSQSQKGSGKTEKRPGVQKWTAVESVLLRHLVVEKGLRWSEIEKHFPNRGKASAVHRWRRMLQDDEKAAQSTSQQFDQDTCRYQRQTSSSSQQRSDTSFESTSSSTATSPAPTKPLGNPRTLATAHPEFPQTFDGVDESRVCEPAGIQVCDDSASKGLGDELAPFDSDATISDSDDDSEDANNNDKDHLMSVQSAVSSFYAQPPEHDETRVEFLRATSSSTTERSKNSIDMARRHQPLTPSVPSSQKASSSFAVPLRTGKVASHGKQRSLKGNLRQSLNEMDMSDDELAGPPSTTDQLKMRKPKMPPRR